MPPLVSVYLATKNRRDSLSLAVRSVLQQTYSEVELVVVDDGSTDDTPEFLTKLASQDSRVRFLRHEKSRGAPSARNGAIVQAQGQFITGLDDDDLFMPERISCLVQLWQLLEASNQVPSFLYTQDYVAVQGGSRTASKKLGSVEYADMFWQNHVGNQIFVPTERLRQVGLYDQDLPAWQDLELFMRLLKTYGPARLLDLPLYVFDVTPRPDRISGQSKKRLWGAFERVASRHALGTPRLQQQLFLQLFREAYGFRPTPNDFVHFVRLGIWPAGCVRLIRACLPPRLS